MAAAMAIEYLFTRKGYLPRATRNHGQPGDGQLVIEGVAFATKPAAVRSCNHPYVTGRDPKHLCKRAMHIVWSLGRTPEGQLMVGVVMGGRRVLLHRQVGISFIKEKVFAD